ncbi:hypothetical protein NUBL21985_54760 [Klebsiella pneumoniae]|nr:hypothetical protein NUBL21985_54760 [Klebsiella pneumoniae]
MFAGKKSAQIREILISESAWEEMTCLFAPSLGVVPLMLASGASDSTQHAIGTGVFGGMISGTLLAIFFVPVFFVTITRFTGMRKDRPGNSRNG